MGIKKINKNYTSPPYTRVRCPECKESHAQRGGKVIAHSTADGWCPAGGHSIREYLKMKAFKEPVVKLEAVNGDSVLVDLKGNKVESDNVEVLFTVPATVKAVKSY